MNKLTPHRESSGFTTVEFIMTLFIGVVFVIAGYELFTVVTADGTASRDRSIASNLANRELNRVAVSSQDCSASTTTATIPSPTDEKLIDPTITSRSSWPYGCTGIFKVKKVEVIVTYGEASSRKEVRHALMVQV